MGTRPNALFAWGFEVLNTDSTLLDHLFDDDDGIEDGWCAFENHDEDGPAFVYVKDSSICTDWDDVKTIHLTQRLAEPGWNDKLKAFCEKNKIPWKEPAWFLAAYSS